MLSSESAAVPPIKTMETTEQGTGEEKNVLYPSPRMNQPIRNNCRFFFAL
jgi:hypothetical protein